MGVISIASGVFLLALVYLYPQTFLARIPSWVIKCFAVLLIAGGFLVAFFPAGPSEAHPRVGKVTGSSIGAGCIAVGIYLLARVFFYPQTFLPKIPRWAITSFGVILIISGFLVAFWNLF